MAWTDNLFRWLGFGRYNSTLPTVGEGQVEELQVDQRGRLRVSLESTSVALDVTAAEPETRYLSSARETQASAKASAGVVREVLVHSNSGTDRWLQLHDKASAVTSGDAPIYRSIVPAGSQVSITFSGGRSFTNGLQIALSSAELTWTDPAADEALFYVEMD